MDKYIPLDVWQYNILIFCALLEQIRLRQVCKIFHKLEIHDFRHVDDLYKILNNNILLNYPFIRKIRGFPVNSMMTNFNHLTKLYKLNLNGYCNTNNNEISNLCNLKKLYLYNNPRITKINHLTNLTKLDIRGMYCQIGDNEISELSNLKILYASCNTNIKNISHLTKLEVFYGAYCDIDNENLKNLTNLIKLGIGNNNKITNINHLINLEYLYMNKNCVIKNDGFSKLTNLNIFNSIY